MPFFEHMLFDEKFKHAINKFYIIQLTIMIKFFVLIE